MPHVNLSQTELVNVKSTSLSPGNQPRNVKYFTQNLTQLTLDINDLPVNKLSIYSRTTNAVETLRMTKNFTSTGDCLCTPTLNVTPQL